MKNFGTLKSFGLPSLTGAKPSCLARASTGATASSSSLDKNTTWCPPSTTGSAVSLAANEVVEPLD